jgi:hypothetical protein
MAPEPYERFEYVIVKKHPYKYDTEGRQTKISIGDRMEFATTALEEDMEIDVDYYILKNITGQLARFLSYHPQFYEGVRPDTLSEEEFDKLEENVFERAKKFVISICAKWSEPAVSEGPVRKAVYKKLENICKSLRSTQYEKFDKAIKAITAEAKREVQQQVRVRVSSQKNIEDLLRMRRSYQTMLQSQKLYYSKQYPVLESSLRVLSERLDEMDDSKRILNSVVDRTLSNVHVKTENDVEIYKQKILTDIENNKKNIELEIISNTTDDAIIKSHEMCIEIEKIKIQIKALIMIIEYSEQILEEINIRCRNKYGDVSVGRINHLDDLDDYLEQNFN